jgi:hypothetical protein
MLPVEGEALPNLIQPDAIPTARAGVNASQTKEIDLSAT